jgi:hypothetical protein
MIKKQTATVYSLNILREEETCLDDMALTILDMERDYPGFFEKIGKILEVVRLSLFHLNYTGTFEDYVNLIKKNKKLGPGQASQRL